jgi:nanoRNase/pAp phosphatase (c-di-AMP/oligoRNAs hydrolase)
MSEAKLKQLAEVIGDAGEILIIPHNDPDPDAIASVVGLQYLLAEWLGVTGRIRYRGIIGRSENKALLRVLNNSFQRLEKIDLNASLPIALVDTQPGAGNNPLPKQGQATIIIDHHAWRTSSLDAPFVDVRPDIGATATIILEYLLTAGIELPPKLATALFYGIKTDTRALSRGATAADKSAYLYLQPHIDVLAMVEIEQAQVPIDYFINFDAALHAASLYSDVLIGYIGLMKYPDLAAEIADVLMRLKGARWVLFMGIYKQTLILSVRTRDLAGGAGVLVQQIVRDQGTAGGHGALAGGQVPLRGRNPKQLADTLKQIALRQLNVRPGTPGKPVIPKPVDEIND